MPIKKISKTATKKTVVPKSTPKSLTIDKAFSKSEIMKAIAEMVGSGKKQVTETIDALTHIIKSHLSHKGPGVFVFPGLAKFRIVKKPATKARKGKNPFTGEPMTFAAKPASKTVKIKPLKKLKDIAK